MAPQWSQRLELQWLGFRGVEHQLSDEAFRDEACHDEVFRDVGCAHCGKKFLVFFLGIRKHWHNGSDSEQSLMVEHGILRSDVVDVGNDEVVQSCVGVDVRNDVGVHRNDDGLVVRVQNDVSARRVLVARVGKA